MVIWSSSVSLPGSVADSRDRRPEPRKGWRDEECIEDARRGSAGPLDAGFSAAGARPSSSRSCPEHWERDTLVGTSSIVAIGDELVGGFTLDTNSHWMAERLRLLGYPVKRGTQSSDKPHELVEQLHRE